ncbi:ImmA/IrrE family metallo-endopeptidase [Staphylococcus lugdunensis]|uniref:ImmA/IrrE family metallo-endopeptidase n=1 Tax=Staphylococcus lugdunensis TaxID=28035 RepID=UPI002263B625|nr:ImmA/IrrE family metallo-endopeptidase [Staphylococcus lugdunensis]UZW89816.1 ImmA/IrrE family metallo-endopeptidase [Staphylococcus lugdunensis]
MGKYEDLLIKFDYISIEESKNMPDFLSGMCVDGNIFINSNRTISQQLEILSEELAHYKLTHGNIIDASDFNNRKFENYARRYAKERLLSLDGIIKAFKSNVHNLYELANFFEVTESYVIECIEHYKQKYGLTTRHGNYVIQFEPLRVFEYKEIKKRGNL